MPRHRRKPRRSHATQAQTIDQLTALIPAGSVNAQQARRVVVEQVAVGENKNVLVTRQVVSTALRKLLDGGYITNEEFGAAVRLRDDYESAFETSRNPLEVVQVDGIGGARGSGDQHGAMLHKVNAAIRVRDVQLALGPHQMHILKIVVLDEGKGRGCFTTLGAELAPRAPVRQQQDIGRGAAIPTLRNLAWFYERGVRRGGRRGAS